ncbi:CAP domain-containing protein [Bacillus sp. FJAT-45037]|uniref:CAP domain-containing protein n=1 Tax=Bacillus sp. FJAT-45037 TaxID=2011007 RepID=UPI0018E21AE3|nr:CAP domain-containing protein [Bacillus sp. FJAT-45037]
MKTKLVISSIIVLFLCVSLFEYIFNDEIKTWFQGEEGLIVYNEIESEELEENQRMESVEPAPTPTEELESTEDGPYPTALTIGANKALIKENYGEPSRIDPSPYGYEWWVYEKGSYYILIGIDEGVVVTTFTTSADLTKEDTYFGQTYQAMNEIFDIKPQVEVKVERGQYNYELTAGDLAMRPLVKIDEAWAQLYFDVHTNQLSSIRFLDDETLMKQRPYSLSYRGSLPEVESLSDSEWEMVEKGQAKQIFTFTNVLRERHGLESLVWNEPVSSVAYLHSLDMEQESYFSHTSPTYGELSDRLDRRDVKYRLAGENIAAKYVDGLASVEGWLNSEGHRVNVLHEEFTELGVGVYRDYYTQNFMTPFFF